MAGRQDYEERRQNKIDRLNAAAYKASKESAAAFERSNKAVDGIPLGQPNIGGALTGAINRSRQAMDKSFKESEKASYYASKAEATENNNAISSDDPNSINKLQEKINKLKKEQDFAKTLNAYYRKNGTCKGYKDMSDGVADKWDKAAKGRYSWEQKPYASYELTSINQRIKAAQTRIDEIKAVESMPAETIEYDGLCELVSDADINRITIDFYIDLTEEQVNKLKFYGFKWAYTDKKWQRLRNPYSLHIAKRLIEEIKTKN